MVLASFIMLYFGMKNMKNLSTRDQNKIKGLSQNFSPYGRRK